jgi:hypothetical protein
VFNGGWRRTQMGKYKVIMNDWNYDASYMITSIPVWNFKGLDFCCIDRTSLFLSFNTELSLDYGLNHHGNLKCHTLYKFKTVNDC